MSPSTKRGAVAAGMLLASVSCAAWAQVGLPPAPVERALQAAHKGQERAAAAQERIEKIPEQTARVDKAQERIEKIPDQAARADKAQERIEKIPDQAARADKAQERIEKIPEQSARADKAQERIEKIPDQTSRADRANERAGNVPGQAERSQRADQAQTRSAERSQRGEPRPDDRADRAGGRSGEHRRAAKPERDGERQRNGEGKGEEKKSAQAGAAKRKNGATPGAAADPQTAAVHRALADAHQQRLEHLVRSYPRELEMTRDGPAVRGQVVAVDPTPAILAAVRKAGYRILVEETIQGLGIRSVTLETPRGVSVDSALAQLAKLAPRGEFAANHLHVQTSAAAMGPPGNSASLALGRVMGTPALGLIDGGVARHPALTGPIEQRGFAAGAPAPNSHATAVASLAAGQGRLRGALPGAPMVVADIYGTDPTGGNAVALVKALGWMTARRVPVVAITLAGPSNALVAKAVARAAQSGVFIVAPVGNFGPAAPPSYPASYPPVVAVTGVDSSNRLLIESGRSPSLDYAAPAAGFVAANASGGLAPVRGTSFGVPFVAARIAGILPHARPPLPSLDREAVDLGAPGPDPLYGRGLVCARCPPRGK
jgi:hypothetical protein